MPVQHLPVVLDQARVLADQAAAEVVDRRGDGQLAPLERGLAEADQALVGLDPDEVPVLPGDAHELILDRGDLHGAAHPFSPVVTTPWMMYFWARKKTRTIGRT